MQCCLVGDCSGGGGVEDDPVMSEQAVLGDVRSALCLARHGLHGVSIRYHSRHSAAL